MGFLDRVRSGVRQWVESVFDTLNDQLSLERHGGRTLAGLVAYGH